MIDEKGLFRQLSRGSAAAFLVQVGGAALGLLVHIFIARVLGVAEYGLYTLTLTWVSVLSVVALLGQKGALSRFVPVYIQREDWGALKGIKRRVRGIVVLTSVGISLVAAICVFVLRGLVSHELLLTLLAGFLLLPVLAMLQFSGALHRAIKNAASSIAFNSLLRPAILIALLLIYWKIIKGVVNAPIVVLVGVLAAVLALLLSELFLERKWPRLAKLAQPKYETRSWLRLGGHLFFMALIGIVLSRVDVLVLGGIEGSKVVGPYYAAVQLAALALYGLNAVNTILAPMIAERYAIGDKEGLRILVNKAARLIFFTTLIVSSIASATGYWVLGFFGAAFHDAYIPLLIILLGQCVSAALGPAGFLMTMTQYEKQALIIFGGGAALNLVMSFTLIPALGLLGAAIATASSSILWSFASFVFVYLKLQISSSFLYKYSPR